MTRVIMHGCNGHMGQVITKLAEEDTDVEIVAGVDPFDDGHNSYPVFSSIEKCDVDADVVIDFSSAKAEDALIDYCTASKLPVIVDFYSDSCVACKKLAPVLGDIEDDYEDKLHVYKVNTNFDGELADEYEVTANPTLLFVKDAEVLDRKVGAQKPADLKAWVEELL